MGFATPRGEGACRVCALKKMERKKFKALARENCEQAGEPREKLKIVKCDTLSRFPSPLVPLVFASVFLVAKPVGVNEGNSWSNETSRMKKCACETKRL